MTDGSDKRFSHSNSIVLNSILKWPSLLLDPEVVLIYVMITMIVTIILEIVLSLLSNCLPQIHHDMASAIPTRPRFKLQVVC